MEQSVFRCGENVGVSVSCGRIEDIVGTDGNYRYTLSTLKGRILLVPEDFLIPLEVDREGD